jgi:hypothetical protein
MSAQIWTDGRKWMANLLPLIACAWIPPLALWLDSTQRPLIATIAWAALPVCFWLAINFLSLAGNANLRSAMRPALERDIPDAKGNAHFVGFSRPKAKGGVHPHEDIGWLVLLPDRIEFLGETQRHSFDRADIRRVRFAANINTLFGLGRWLVVEANDAGKRVQMRFEPRERGTMFGNLLLSRKLGSRVREWVKSGR